MQLYCYTVAFLFVPRGFTMVLNEIIWSRRYNQFKDWLKLNKLKTGFLTFNQPSTFFQQNKIIENLDNLCFLKYNFSISQKTNQ